ncbi:hypothetical protein Acsp07_19680 [Actinomycetospora sp. NBRC 106378]|nr:hypothetical protein Acsp07_19680 [Actinomycetospora sp. NBRC 106378]
MSPRRGPGRTRVRSADETLPPGTGDLFVSQVRLDPDDGSAGYPWDLPVVRALRAAGGLAFDRPVTFVVGLQRRPHDHHCGLVEHQFVHAAETGGTPRQSRISTIGAARRAAASRPPAPSGPPPRPRTPR